MNESRTRMRLLGPAPFEVWDRLAENDPTATVYQTRAWAESVKESYRRARITTRAFVLEDGALAVLPSLERQFGPFHAEESAPDTLFGGPIAERPLNDGEVGTILRSLPHGLLARFSVSGNPYAPWSLASSKSTRRIFTQSVDLSPGLEKVHARFKKACQRRIRLAQRSGLEFCLASTESDFHGYYAVYEEAMLRWGKKTLWRVPLHRLLRLRDRFGESLRLWLVKKEGQVLGGNCVLYHGDRAFLWHGAYRSAAFKYGATNFLDYEAIRDACARGCRWYDLGTSAGLEGVIRFKDAFAPQHLYFDRVVVNESPIFRAAQRFRSLLRSVSSR